MIFGVSAMTVRELERPRSGRSWAISLAFALAAGALLAGARRWGWSPALVRWYVAAPFAIAAASALLWSHPARRWGPLAALVVTFAASLIIAIEWSLPSPTREAWCQGPHARCPDRLVTLALLVSALAAAGLGALLTWLVAKLRRRLSSPRD
ncbi:MAG: hypothetical protein AMXMBFR56_02100 [Polyangiaceae bacterium]